MLHILLWNNDKFPEAVIFFFLSNVRAERGGHWSLQLKSISKMLLYLFMYSLASTLHTLYITIHISVSLDVLSRIMTWLQISAQPHWAPPRHFNYPLVLLSHLTEKNREHNFLKFSYKLSAGQYWSTDYWRDDTLGYWFSNYNRGIDPVL